MVDFSGLPDMEAKPDESDLLNFLEKSGQKTPSWPMLQTYNILC